MLGSLLGKSIPPPFEKISPLFGAAKLLDVQQFRWCTARSGTPTVYVVYPPGQVQEPQPAPQAISRSMESDEVCHF
jgi:hypothetical protein